MDYSHRDRPLLLVLFGITGDLAQRYQLPALYQLAKTNELPKQFRIIGISRREVSLDEVYSKLGEFVEDTEYDQRVTDMLRQNTDMHQMDLLDKGAYRTLLDNLATIEATLGDGASRLYYLSIPSHTFAPIVKLLGETGHHEPLAEGDAPRLLIEKPFGYDLRSAKELIDTVDQYFGEGQVYRIDHYVAKETIQNILTFRFENALFKSVWDAEHIENIAVIAHEKIGIEGRATFYEQTGALRDLIQSHLLQLLAITTMAQPIKMESDDIHAEKLRLLEAIQSIAPDEVTSKATRGQYQGYRGEVNNPDSNIETYAKIQLQIHNDQWRGVPVALETGKALRERRTEICITFAKQDCKDANRLIIRTQPKEGITLQLRAKRPGIQNITEDVDMDFDYARAFNTRSTGAYERVIVDAIRGDQTLFASSAEVIRSWEIIENVLEQWSHGANDLIIYEPGSNGPQK